jgi:hypothetical protein
VTGDPPRVRQDGAQQFAATNPQSSMTIHGLPAFPLVMGHSSRVTYNEVLEIIMRLKFISLAFFAALILFCSGDAQAHSVSLTWTASTDAGASYNIYRLTGACPSAGTTGFTKITATPVAATSYSDTTVAPGTYCYYATAVLGGAESVPSNLASAVILPGAPTAVSATPTN